MKAAGTEKAALGALSEDQELSVGLRRLMAVTEASFEQRAQLERALKTRIVVEQAKGVLAERLRVTVAEAFELLRGAARNRQIRVHDLAREVVENSHTPPAILVQLQKSLAPGAGSRLAKDRAGR